MHPSVVLREEMGRKGREGGRECRGRRERTEGGGECKQGEERESREKEGGRREGGRDHELEAEICSSPQESHG